MTGMTCTNAIVLGNTRKAWVDDACGDTWSGKRNTSNGCATRQKHGGLAHYAQSQQTHTRHANQNTSRPQPSKSDKYLQSSASAIARASAL